ncbi:MAG: adenylate kinase [Treponema sp.]|jgi:adenylate kinase|nr:adenylate kinase [Treponema sp.]
MKLIFLGPPGAGKGTVAAQGVAICQVPHISTGAIFRSVIATMSPLGDKVKTIIEAGKLVDDETTVRLVKERLAQADAQKGYILDGFPRTIFQAEALAGFSAVDRVINFDIPDATVLERLLGRRVCRKCGTNFHISFNKPKQAGSCDACGGELFIREDDQEGAIRKRLEVYRLQTLPLIAYYQHQGLLVTIDAQGSVDAVMDRFKQTLGIQ